MAALLVSTVRPYPGKLLGERIAPELAVPVFVGVAAVVALLFTYPYGTLALLTLLYLAVIPVSYARFRQRMR